MFRFLQRHRTFLLTALALVIFGLTFFQIGTNTFTHSPYDAIIKVNGKKISQAQFDRVYNQLSRQHANATPEQQQDLSGQTLNELIREEVFSQEAEKYGVVVTDQELRLQIESTPAFQKDGRFDAQTYVQVIAQSLNMVPHEFEKLRKRDLAARKVNMLIASGVRVPSSVLDQAVSVRIQEEKDAKKKKEYLANPEPVKEGVRNEELNLVFTDWLAQINSNLKVEIISEQFKNRLAAKPS